MEVCRICLVSDTTTTLYNLNNLKTSYETLTNGLLIEDGLPHKLCWECRARLRSCEKFRAKALRSRALLSTMAPLNQNVQKLESIDRRAHNLTSSLTCVKYLYQRDSENKKIWIEIGTDKHWRPAPQKAPSRCTDGLPLLQQGAQVKEESDCNSESTMSKPMEESLDTSCDVKQELASPSTLQSDLDTDPVQHPKQLHGSTFIHKIKIERTSEEHADTLIKTQGSESSRNSFECDKCGNSYDTKLGLEKHPHTHTLLEKSYEASDKKFNCTSCGSKFILKSALTRHMKSQHIKYVYCNECDYKTVKKSRLLVHQRKHTREKPYECDCCDLKSSSRDGARKHSLVHASENHFQCNVCGTNYSSKRSLSIHQNKHTAPFKCKQCSYSCRTLQHLVTHEKTHAEENTIKCEFCEYRSIRKNNMKLHFINMHTDEKPFKCDNCEYVCKRKVQLSLHMKIHSRRKHKCGICGYKCSKGELRNHLHTSHNIPAYLTKESGNF